jgi:hypothetical protein
MLGIRETIIYLRAPKRLSPAQAIDTAGPVLKSRRRKSR